MSIPVTKAAPPNGWVATPLKYLAAINQRTLGEDHPANAIISYLDVGAVGRGQLKSGPDDILFGAAPSRARRVVASGDILVSTVRTYLRSVIRIECEHDNLIASTGFAVLTPSPEVDGRFLYYWCLSDHFIEPVVAKSVGVSYPAINSSELGRLPVALPSLDVQRRVADTLDVQTARIGTLVKKNVRVASLLRKRVLARSAQVFGINAADRDGGSLIRAKWLVNEVDERAGSRADQLPHLSVSEYQGVMRRPTDTAGQSASEDSSHYKVCRAGDLVLNKLWGFRGAIGVAPEPGLVSPDYAVLRPGNGQDPRYLHHLFRSPPFVAQMAAKSRGIGGVSDTTGRSPRISVQAFGDIRVRMRPLNEQRVVVSEFEAGVAKVDALIERVERMNKALGQRRQSLVTAAVTGQIEV